MKRTFEITFRFLHTKEIGYFEICDLDDLCRYETKTKIIRTDNQQKAENIIKHHFGKTTEIQKLGEIRQEERTL